MEKVMLPQKKEIVMQKIFGHSSKYAKSIIRRFGENIEKIGDCDVKDYVMALKELQKITDVSIIEEIFNKCDGKDATVDKITFKK